MMGMLRVNEPGVLTTVQDLGRSGYGAMGVPASGAFDGVSLRIGNRLLGNPDHAAALECAMLGPGVTFDCDMWVCLTGAVCPNARIVGDEGERGLPWCEPVRVRAGERVEVGGMRDGAYAYLCVFGGIVAPIVLGSRSTLVGAGFGGHEGRALREGDRVVLGASTHEPASVPDGLHGWLRESLDRRTLRVVASLHAERFPEGAMARFEASVYTVGAHSNRVGIRLEGSALPLPEGAGSFESEPTVTGGVQVSGDGQPIVLGVDRPTTGGYPLLACVIRADLGALAMLRPKDSVRFEVVSFETARELAAAQRSELDGFLPACAEGGGA